MSEESPIKRTKRSRSESLFVPPRKLSRSQANIADAESDTQLLIDPYLLRESEPKSINKLIIGLDLGTTRSGAAWSLKTGQDSSHVTLECVHSIDDYDYDPSISPETREDFPTEVQFDEQLFDHLQEGEVNKRCIKALVGFEIDHVTKNVDSPGHKAQTSPLKLVKLLLSDDPDSEKIRIRLRADIQDLIAAGVLDEEDDVIVHIFRYMLEHTFTQISKQRDVLRIVQDVEFAIGIPPAWSVRGRRREMNALQKAIEQTEFERRFHCSRNIFAITETEAAATYLLYGTNKFSVRSALRCPLNTNVL